MNIRKSIKTGRNVSRMLRATGLALLVISVQGCIVLPIPQLPKNHVTNIADEQIEFIQSGETRREDIQRELGTPQHSLDDDLRWLYVVKSHRAGGVRLCGGMIDPISLLDDPDHPEGVGGCTREKQARKVTYLDIEFSESGIVANHQLTAMKNNGNGTGYN